MKSGKILQGLGKFLGGEKGHLTPLDPPSLRPWVRRRIETRVIRW
jgi:hypothetical protein